MDKFLKRIDKLNTTLKRAADFSSAKQQLLSDPAVTASERALLTKVKLRVHPNDGMYQGNAHHYLSVGLSAIRCIEAALEKSSNDQPVRSILDFPCGYGRVLRFLQIRFPHAKISASEIDPNMMNFCRHAFSANPIKSDLDFNKISLQNKFDLIWCGSLITHIDEMTARDLLRFFYNHLSPNGLCVFTTHGQFSVDSLRNKTITYGLLENEQNEVISQFHKKGYGISTVSHEHMISITSSVGNWQEVFFVERGWDNHQDVYGFAMSASDH